MESIMVQMFRSRMTFSENRVPSPDQGLRAGIFAMVL